jgi:hypothetical protein
MATGCPDGGASPPESAASETTTEAHGPDTSETASLAADGNAAAALTALTTRRHVSLDAPVSAASRRTPHDGCCSCSSTIAALTRGDNGGLPDTILGLPHEPLKRPLLGQLLHLLSHRDHVRVEEVGRLKRPAALRLDQVNQRPQRGHRGAPDPDANCTNRRADANRTASPTNSRSTAAANCRTSAVLISPAAAHLPTLQIE